MAIRQLYEAWLEFSTLWQYVLDMPIGSP